MGSKPKNSNILKFLPNTGCLQPRLRKIFHFFFQEMKFFFHGLKLVLSVFQVPGRICVYVCVCVCVFVFVYLHVRHLGTLFLRSLYHYIFKNITHVRPICNLCVMCHVGHACHVCHICDVT